MWCIIESTNIILDTILKLFALVFIFIFIFLYYRVYKINKKIKDLNDKHSNDLQIIKNKSGGTSDGTEMEFKKLKENFRTQVEPYEQQKQRIKDIIPFLK